MPTKSERVFAVNSPFNRMRACSTCQCSSIVRMSCFSKMSTVGSPSLASAQLLSVSIFWDFDIFALLKNSVIDLQTLEVLQSILRKSTYFCDRDYVNRLEYFPESARWRFANIREVLPSNTRWVQECLLLCSTRWSSSRVRSCFVIWRAF